MKKIKCNEPIPEECISTYTYDKKGNPIEIAGEMCEVKCVCGKCMEGVNDK